MLGGRREALACLTLLAACGRPGFTLDGTESGFEGTAETLAEGDAGDDASATGPVTTSGSTTASSATGDSTSASSSSGPGTATATSDPTDTAEASVTTDPTDSWSESAEEVSTEASESWTEADADEVTTSPETWGSESSDWGEDDGGDPDLTCPPYWIDQVGSTEPDYGYAVAVHPNGGIYVAGTAGGPLAGLEHAGRSDFYLSRYSPEGVREWTRMYGSSEAEEVRGLAIDAVGSIYLVGTTDGSFGGTLNAGDYDLMLNKLNANGDLLWTRSLGTAGLDAGYGVAVGPDAEVYVAGVSDGRFDDFGVPGNRHAFAARFSSEGELEWVNQEDGGVGDGARALGLDAEGNIYLTGERHDGPAEQPSSESELFLRRISSGGSTEWTQVISDAGVNRGYGVAVAPDGTSFIIGSTSGDLWGQGNQGSGDAFIMRHSPEGERAWTRQIGTGAVDYGSGITLDAQGFIYATGTTLGGIDGNESSGLGDMFVSKLASDGDKIWTQQLGTSSLDRGWAIATNPQLGVYLAGSTEGVLAGETVFGGWDVAVVRLCEIEP